jgi:RHS repeat-associated protein
LPSFVEDRNGNRLTVTDSGNGAFSYSDTAGRTAVSSSGFGAAGNTVAVSGLANPYTLTWASTSFSFSPPNTAVVYQDGYCSADRVPGASGDVPVVTALALPNGEEYSFSYDPTYGMVNQINYPTGGYVKYAWGVNPQADFVSISDTYNNPNTCQYTYDSFAVLYRYVSFDGSTIALQQAFSYSTTWNGGNWTSKTTTVTTTDQTRSPNVVTTQTYTYTPISVPIYPYESYYVAPQAPVESSIVYQDSGGNILRTVNKTWYDQYEMACESVTQGGQVSRIDYAYGAGAQVTDKKEWDWGQAPACSSTSSGTPRRETVTAYQTFGDTLTYAYGPSIFDRPSTVTVYGNGSEAAQTQYVYDSPAVTSAGITVGRDTAYNGNTTVARGNLTQKTEVLLNGCSGCASPVTGYTNDDTGQRLTMKDPRGNTTSYSYADSYASGSPPGLTNAYLTKITYPNTGVAHVESFKYNYADGHLASSTDQNSQTTGYSYNDSLDRLTSISYPDGGLTSYAYSDAPSSSYWGCTSRSANVVEVTASKSINSGLTLVTKSLLDGLGHPVQTQLVSDPSGTDCTDTADDGLGRVYTVSNPYRSTSDSTYGIRTYTYDAVGRTTNVQYADNNNTSTSYAANCATVTDPAGKERQTCSDGLGRLTQVTEDPGGLGYASSYSYDALDNLTGVTQFSQTRSFLYDSLSRLASATNPESGTVSYTGYDGNGNLLTRVDARSITTTYSYDALNRLTQKSYSDGTPTAYYYYDQTGTGLWGNPTLNNPLGRLTSTATNTNPGGTLLAATVYSYDPMGRVQDLWQCTPYNCSSSAIWDLHYTYDLAGDVASWTHPAVFTVTNTLNSAQQITQMAQSNYNNSYPQYPAQSITYTAFGAVSTLVNGCAGNGCTQVQETYNYNNRLQPVRIQLGTSSSNAANYCLVYNYYAGVANPTSCSIPAAATSGNNGTVMGYLYQDTTNPSLGHTAAYTYDSLNRLTSAVASGSSTYNLTFSTGPYGNTTCSTNAQTNGPCTNLTYDVTTNHITVSGYAYDAAGNVTADGTGTGSHTYQWDAEGRLASVDTGTTEQETYNALGQLAQFNTPTYVSNQPYDPGGAFLGQYNSTGGFWWEEDIRFQGRILAYNLGGVHTVFLHKDALGSSHMAMGPAGNWLQDQLFYPWGQSWQSLGTWQEQGFAAFDYLHPSDNLYPTQFRNYAPLQGRWLSPDPDNAGADASDPQTWNAYAYVRNNPTTLIDPTGEVYQVCQSDAGGNQSGCASISDVQFGQFQQQNQNLLTFTGGNAGNVLYQGNEIGTFQQTRVDANVSGLAAVELGVGMAAPGVNLAASGLRAFGYVVAPPLMAAAECLAGAPSCTKSNIAMALLPGGEEIPEVVTPTAGQVSQAEQVLLQQGRGSVEKAIRTFERLIAEHEEKIRNATGHSSSMERELQNFKQLLQAYKQVLGR